MAAGCILNTTWESKMESRKYEVSDAKALHNLFDVRTALYCRVCSQKVPNDCSVHRSRCSGRGCDQQGQERQHEAEDDSSASRQSCESDATRSRVCCLVAGAERKRRESGPTESRQEPEGDLLNRHSVEEFRCVCYRRAGSSSQRSKRAGSPEGDYSTVRDAANEARAAGGFLLGFQLGQRIVEVETEQPRILSDHGRRHNIEDVVVGLLRYLVSVGRKQPPEIAIPRVRG